MSPSSVTFPALCVPKDFGVYFVRDLAQLRRCRAQLFWRYRHFDGLRLFDSAEKVFQVTATAVSAPKTELGRLFARWLDLQLTVDVEVSPIGSASRADVVSAVRQAIDVDPESFDELSGRSVEWWQSTLANCVSVREIILAFQ